MLFSYRIVSILKFGVRHLTKKRPPQLYRRSLSSAFCGDAQIALYLAAFPVDRDIFRHYLFSRPRAEVGKESGRYRRGPWTPFRIPYFIPSLLVLDVLA